MREWLVAATEFVVPIIDGIALIIIVVGTVEAVFGLRAMFTTGDANAMRAVWLRYARWLVGALTYQLAADILETAVAPSWDDIGRLGVIALIRTFLNYFLERDVAEVRDRQRGDHCEHPAT